MKYAVISSFKYHQDRFHEYNKPLDLEPSLNLLLKFQE